MQLVTIGIDPGADSALAMWRDDILVSLRDVHNDAFDTDRRCYEMRRLRELCRPDDHALVAIEAQFFGVNPGLGPKAAIGRMRRLVAVAENAARWEEAARLVGFDLHHERVYPQSWRATFKLTMSTRKKEDAADLVEEHVVGRSVSHDEAEAALLALHIHIKRHERRGLSTLDVLEWVPCISKNR